ncbi:hypothetical protein BKA62DRAFT_717508 [Auriculariales sp. MPI-PUGE-AT-0066]|nr:hypothetical protein BKA62DRAFT_717508 [Auriculariales sp. MPI-PUGE-AT-0066]
MARRSAPPHSAPAYVTRPSPVQPPKNENAVQRFIREEILSPEHLAGNITIATGVGLFVAGIAIVRTWGELMIPA